MQSNCIFLIDFVGMLIELWHSTQSIVFQLQITHFCSLSCRCCPQMRRVTPTEAYQHTCSGKYFQSSKKKKIYLVAGVIKAGICPTPFTKIASGMQKSYSKENIFASGSRREEGAIKKWQGNSQSKGGICHVNFSKQNKRFLSTLGKSLFSISSKETTSVCKREGVGTAPAHI